MAEVEITHAFVSTKAESPDNSLVSAHEWNDKLMIGGGTPGSTMVRDPGQPHGGRWTQGVQAYTASGTASGGIGSTPPLASITVTFTSAGTLLIAVNVVTVTSAGQSALVSIVRNGAVVRQFSARGDGVATVARFDVFAESPGTYTYHIVESVTTGSITSAAIDSQIIIFGN